MELRGLFRTPARVVRAQDPETTALHGALPDLLDASACVGSSTRLGLCGNRGGSWDPLLPPHLRKHWWSHKDLHLTRAGSRPPPRRYDQLQLPDFHRPVGTARGTSTASSPRLPDLTALPGTCCSSGALADLSYIRHWLRTVTPICALTRLGCDVKRNDRVSARPVQPPTSVAGEDPVLALP